MAVQRVGFWRELRHGDPDGPSLHDSVRRGLREREAEIVRYLRDSPTLAATGVRVNDYLNSDNRAVAPLETATDGTWIWPRDLPYYVETYSVALPTAFVQHMKQRNWEPPELTYEELVAVENALFGE